VVVQSSSSEFRARAILVVGGSGGRVVLASRQTVTANRPNDADDAGQWLLTLFLGPIAVVLAAIVIGLLMRGSGLR
jgi:hypothetical protein